jgi:hypothetical protein
MAVARIRVLIFILISSGVRDGKSQGNHPDFDLFRVADHLKSGKVFRKPRGD